MGTTLLFLFLCISLIPLVLVGYYNYNRMQSTNFNAIQENLNIVVDIGHDHFLRSIEKNIKSIKDKSKLSAMTRVLENINEVIASESITIMEYLASQEWKDYQNNEWKEFAREIQYKEDIDMFVLDIKGNTLFTVKNKAILGTNVLNEETKLSNACRDALQLNSVIFSGLGYYPAGSKTLSSFLVNTIKNENHKSIALLVYKLDFRETYQFIQTLGTGHSGHVYIVGDDLLLRSPSKFIKDSRILNLQVKTAMTNMWKQNLKDGGTRSYSFMYPNYNGVRVLGMHRPLNIAGTKLAVIAEINEDEVLESVNLTRKITIRIMLLTGIIVLFISVIIVRSIVRPIIQLSDWAKIASSGDFRQLNFSVPNNEIGDLRKIFSTLVSKMSDTASQARSIAAGDYSLNIKPLSDRDQLALALKTMTESLQKFQLETQRQDWLKTGLTELNEKIQGEHSLEELSQKVVQFIAEYIDIQLGAIYIKTEDELYTLISGYAYKGSMGTKIKVGEGLIGQAALEGKKIVLTEVPETFYRIQTGIGGMLPKVVLLLPMIYEDNVEAILEIGSTEVIDDQKMDFLELIAESIAIAISSAKSRIKLSDLFKESQEQGEILKGNQLELKKTNEELEEKTKYLESQKKEITDKNNALKEAQRDLEKKAEEVERSSKYKSEFLANMSHELRTPLNSLLILSRDLFDNKLNNLNDEQVESAEIIYNSGSDLLTLINEILDLSKIEAGKLSINIEDVQIQEIIDVIRINFKHVVAEKGLDLFINAEKDLPFLIQTDQQRLVQILKNLMSNAIKFTSAGSISVSIFKPEIDAVIKNSNLNPRNTIAISVTDTGIGIPVNKQQDIFEAFQQADGSTSRKYGGTGLGLSISLELTKLLGGVIALTSAEGCGATFTVYLPEKLNQQDFSGISYKTETSTKQNTMTYKSDFEVPFDIEDDRDKISESDKIILVVEDDNKFATILYRFCAQRKIKMIHASNGRSGIEYCNKYKPDAVILDVMLPELDGWGVLKSLKANSATMGIPVYMITVEEEPRDIKSKDLVGYSTKPVNNEQLQDVFTELENAIIEKLKKQDQAPDEQINLADCSILLVDDDMRNMFALSKVLTDRGAEVFKAANGQKAIDILGETPSIDCILMDIMMPVMDGYEAMMRIRQKDQYANLPIIALTAKAMEEDREKCIDAGASDYIAKPVEIDNLMVLLNKWLNT